MEAKTDEAVEQEDVPTEDAADTGEATETSDENAPEEVMVTRMVKVELDDEAKAAVADKMAALWERKNEAEEKKATATKNANSKIKGIESDIEDLVQKYRTGETSIEVECAIDYDWDNRKKSFVRKDTGEVIDEDAISEAEMQRQFPGMDATEDQSGEGEAAAPDDEPADCYAMTCGACTGRMCQSVTMKPDECNMRKADEPDNFMACGNDKCDEISADGCTSDSIDAACIGQCPYYQAPEGA